MQTINVYNVIYLNNISYNKIMNVCLSFVKLKIKIAHNAIRKILITVCNANKILYKNI